jgi:isomerase DpgB
MSIAYSALAPAANPNVANNLVTLNAASPLSAAMISDVSEACNAIEDREEQAALVVYLKGSSTLSADMRWVGDNASVQLATSWERALRRLEQLPCPIVAAADGICGAAALEILLCCDVRIATPNMCIRRDPASLAWPGMLLYRLAKELGTARTRSLLLRCEDIPASDAAAVGLLDAITTDLGQQLTLELTQMPNASVVPIFRRLLSESFAMTYEDALGIHLAACEKFIRLRSAR